ncbi:MAG TPA: saccharopine dehydrogenase NADP-binding domain-containing protein [Micromonosporaceae bacterium]|nr:saccharopine dehydrogenase NADP-binding domain-containing protein [Micromonosporaceae bacterium]
MTSSQRRDLDLVLFGATGFTGALTAEYLAAHVPPGARWGMAGRNRAKLAALRDRLGVDAAILDADVGDRSAMRRLAEAARVVISTVGPFLRYGEPVVAACAEAGTDYVDITGEPEFVDRMYLAHHATAERTGARLVHACGFDSIPHDLGALFTVSQFPSDVAIRMRGYLSARGVFSGGTFESAVTALSRFRQASAVHAERRRAHAPAGTRRARAVPGRPGYDGAVGAWVLPLPTIDPQIVVRSARALDRYGPDFTYSHFLAVRSPLTLAGLGAGAAGVFAMAQVPATRRLLLRMRPSGAGPSQQQRAGAWFRVLFRAQGGGRRVVTEVSGGDPGYGETAKMLAESALCLAYDDLPQTAGQVTTAVAMGDVLRERLERAGIEFRLVEPAITQG